MKTIVLGLDAFDPRLFENLLAQGKLPNLEKLAGQDSYSHLGVSNPPQSEVSWTSIATGLNPGGHGIFDFVHRDPASYTPFVSLLPTKKTIGGIQFASPFTAPTFFEHAVRKGFPAKALWWPATFPARPELPVATIPGLGTPDILGKLGVGTQFSLDREPVGEKIKTGYSDLIQKGRDRFQGILVGPAQGRNGKSEAAQISFEFDMTSRDSARLTIGKQSIELVEGKWSPILELSFKIGLFLKVHAITRVILTHSKPSPVLYFLPLQIHPLHSLWRYGTPHDFVQKSWVYGGRFLSIGWPQDTTGLEDGCITDQQFLDLCEEIFTSREAILLSHLKEFREGVIASVFDSLDRIQHMFWRDRPEIIEDWYVRLDRLVGKTLQFMENDSGEPAHLIVISDHGFTAFNTKVHLNRWLLDNGYLFTKSDDQGRGLANVDWSRTRFYALGLNSLYLNLQGREGQGIVTRDQVETLLERISGELTTWLGPDGRQVVNHCYPRAEAFQGSLIAYGPDLLVGYSPGYRGSQQTGLGGWENVALEPNLDHWGADHCIDPKFVPGVLFSSRGLQDLLHPTYEDIPTLVLGEKVISGDSNAPNYPAGEDQEVLEERLKSLGYL